MTKRAEVLILIVMLIPSFLLAANSKTGTTTATFLKIETGVRAVGMGGAYVAVADDVSAVYWNPAGLMQIKSKDFNFVHTAWLEDIHHESAALAIPVNELFAYGLQIVYFGTNDIDRRTVTGTSDGTAKIADYYEGISLACKFMDTVNAGITLKAIQMTLDTEKGNGYALDLGIQQSLPLNLSAGIMVQNLGPKMKVVNTSEKLPANIKAGLAWRALGNKLLLASDIDFPNDREMKLHTGAEYQFNKIFTLRAGYEDLGSLGSSSGMTAGFSINEGFLDEILKVNMQFDYSWLYFGELGSTHRFGISVKF